MRRKSRWVAVLFATLVAATLVVALTGTGSGTPTTTQASTVNDDVQKLAAKLRAFTTVGGRPSDITNIGDLQRAIEAEAATIQKKSSVPPEEGGGPSLDELERLNAKLQLLASLGGNPSTLQGVRADLKRAIEDELKQLRQRDTGK
jgi:hypothetical protein